MKKKYNPFKMIGSYVGAVIFLIIGIFLQDNPLTFLIGRISIYIAQSQHLLVQISIAIILHLIIGFLIGFGVHSIIRSFRRRKLFLVLMLLSFVFLIFLMISISIQIPSPKHPEPELPECVDGEFFCKDNNANICVGGKWQIEICRPPTICGGMMGMKGCGIPPSHPDLPPLPYCGDRICQPGETQYSCPIDCGLPLPVCGNGKCEVFHFSPSLPPYISGTIDERETCPQDCGGPYLPPEPKDNTELIYFLTQKQRPLVGGLQIEIEKNNSHSLCTLGAIVSYGGKNYILTASHCVTTHPTSGAPLPSDIGRTIKQGKDIVGSVYKVADFTGGVDAVLISINPGINSEQKDFLGNTHRGFGTPEIGMKVYKIGVATGQTYGTITEWVSFRDLNEKEWKGFCVTGDEGEFGRPGDSGSAIISVDSNKIVGILSAGGCSSMPQDIKSFLGLLILPLFF